jgi:hypothetical protein
VILLRFLRKIKICAKKELKEHSLIWQFFLTVESFGLALFVAVELQQWEQRMRTLLEKVWGSLSMFNLKETLATPHLAWSFSRRSEASSVSSFQQPFTQQVADQNVVQAQSFDDRRPRGESIFILI